MVLHRFDGMSGHFVHSSMCSTLSPSLPPSPPLLAPPQSVKVATALNWQMVCGCVAASNPTAATFDPVRYNNTYAAEFAAVRQEAMRFAGGFKVCGAETFE